MGVHAAGPGRDEAAGTRAQAEGPGGSGVDEGRRSRGAERSRAGKRDGVAGYLRSGTGSLSERKPALSLNNTRWPTRRHARHVTALSLRHAPCSAPAPPRRPLLSSSLPRHPPFPLPLPWTRPAPGPGCQAGGGRGRGKVRARAVAGLELPSLRLG